MANFYYIQHPKKIHQVEGPVLCEVRLCHSVTFFVSLRHDDNRSCISVFLHCNLKPLHLLKATRLINISNIFPDFCYAYESYILDSSTCTQKTMSILCHSVSEIFFDSYKFVICGLNKFTCQFSSTHTRLLLLENIC